MQSGKLAISTQNIVGNLMRTTSATIPVDVDDVLILGANNLRDVEIDSMCMVFSSATLKCTYNYEKQPLRYFRTVVLILSKDFFEDDSLTCLLVEMCDQLKKFKSCHPYWTYLRIVLYNIKESDLENLVPPEIYSCLAGSGGVSKIIWKNHSWWNLCMALRNKVGDAAIAARYLKKILRETFPANTKEKVLLRLSTMCSGTPATSIQHLGNVVLGRELKRTRSATKPDDLTAKGSNNLEIDSMCMIFSGQKNAADSLMIFLNNREDHKQQVDNHLYILGCCFQSGIGVEQDERQAVQLYQQAADQGHLGSICSLGFCFENGIGVGKDEKHAAHLYQQALELGNLVNSVTKYFDWGLELHQKAADEGIARAPSSSCYDQPEKKEKELHLYQERAEQGDSWAIGKLAKIYCEGSYGVKDIEKGLQLYQEAVDQGNPHALTELAEIYFEGSYGVTKDVDMGLQVCHKALNQGVTRIVRHVLWQYRRTNADARRIDDVNFKKVFKFFKTGAELNDIDCMYELGRCYRDGKGTLPDVEQARTWFRKSFGNGHTKSVFAWALTKVEPETLTQSQIQAVDDVSDTLISAHVLNEWFEWNAQSASYTHSRISLFDCLDATSATLLLAQLLASTLQPSHLRLAYTLTKDISSERNDLHIHLRWVKLEVEDKYEEVELWSKVKLPIDQSFIFKDRVLPIALIGEGRFGKVYLSWLRDERRYVVIKFIRFDLAEENKIAARNVVREQLTCRVLKKIGVCNAVKYLGYTDHVQSRQRGLIFELCADISDVIHYADEARDEKINKGLGKTTQLEKLPDWTHGVRSSLRSNVVFCKTNKWSVAQVITMLRKAAEALLEVHKVGFIHCDIADRNILCSEEGIVQLADFGLAKYVGSHCNDSKLLVHYSKRYFTPGHQYALAWWAPECFGSGDLCMDAVFSWNSDVYAFGITMWQCFAHNDPFSDVKPEFGKEDEVANHIKKLILGGTRPSLIKKGRAGGVLDPETPADLITLINACWKTDPEERPSIKGVIKELQRIESNVKKLGGSLRGGKMSYKETVHKAWFDVASFYRCLRPSKSVDDTSDGTSIHLLWKRHTTYDVCLVHAGEQRLQAVNTIKQFLKEGKLRCFLDHEMEVGPQPLDSTRFALSTCRYAVVILDRNFFREKYPASELMYAFCRMQWIQKQEHLQGWDSLTVVLYNMTVQEYEEGLESSEVTLPKNLCEEVIVIEWSEKGKKLWSHFCIELRATLLEKDNRSSVLSWKTFLEQYSKEIPRGFPSADTLHP